MQKLFIDFEPDGQVTLNEEQSRHIAKSLRMRKGDMLTLTSGNGNDYGCIIENTNGGLVTLSVCYKQANNSEPSVKVTLYQGVPKSSKLEDVIQKCTELGISAICPTLTNRSVSRPDEKSVSIYIGPEGGFEEKEVELIKASGGKIASLGPRILRTQTAPVAALTAIMLLSNNLE